MRMLVTGGAGFIGSNFVKLVHETRPYETTILDSLTYAGSKSRINSILKYDRHEFEEGDIRDANLVKELVENIDVVINFAAESHVDRSIVGAKPFVSTNVQGTQTLLDAANDADVDLYVQISTDEVYGETLKGEFNESDPLKPRNPYAASKASADLLTKSYYATHDLPVIIIRSSNNYGPNQHPEKLIPKFIENAIAGQSLPLYGDGQNIREWTYVEDNCRGILRALEDGEPGETYNIGSGTELSNLEVTERILDKLGKPHDLIEFVQDRPGHDRRYALDSQKIRDLGWSPEWSFDEGLSETIEHYRSRD